MTINIIDVQGELFAWTPNKMEELTQYLAEYNVIVINSIPMKGIISPKWTKTS